MEKQEDKSRLPYVDPDSGNLILQEIGQGELNGVDKLYGGINWHFDSIMEELTAEEERLFSEKNKNLESKICDRRINEEAKLKIEAKMQKIKEDYLNTINHFKGNDPDFMGKFFWKKETENFMSHLLGNVDQHNYSSLKLDGNKEIRRGMGLNY